MIKIKRLLLLLLSTFTLKGYCQTIIDYSTWQPPNQCNIFDPSSAVNGISHYSVASWNRYQNNSALLEGKLTSYSQSTNVFKIDYLFKKIQPL